MSVGMLLQLLAAPFGFIDVKENTSLGRKSALVVPEARMHMNLFVNLWISFNFIKTLTSLNEHN